MQMYSRRCFSSFKSSAPIVLRRRSIAVVKRRTPLVSCVTPLCTSKRRHSEIRYSSVDAWAVIPISSAERIHLTNSQSPRLAVGVSQLVTQGRAFGSAGSAQAFSDVEELNFTSIRW